jgi:hypothetical protein
MTTDELSKLLHKTTPGPWAVGESRHGGRYKLVNHSVGPGFICEVQIPTVGSDLDYAKGDALCHLIALAPDLAAELIALRSAAYAMAEALKLVICFEYLPLEMGDDARAALSAYEALK